MKSLPWLRIASSLLAGGLAFFVLWHAPWSWPRASIPNCLDSEFEFTPDSKNLVVWQGVKVVISSTLHLNEPGIHVHDAATGDRRCTFEASDEAYFRRLTFAPDSSLAVNSGNSLLLVWETASGKQAQPMTRIKNTPYAFFAPDGEVVLSFLYGPDHGRTLRHRDGKVIADYRHLIKDADWIATDAGSLAAHATAKEIRVIDRCTGQDVHAFPLPAGRKLWRYQLWAGGKILTAHSDTIGSEAYLWTRPDCEPTRCEYLGDSTAFHISPDGKWIAASRPVPQSPWLGRMMEKLLRQPPANSALHIIRLENGWEMASIRDGVDARISPDGRTLAVSCNGDGRLELWDFPLHKPTLLIGLLSVLVGLTMERGLRWRQNRRRPAQPTLTPPT